ncbi:M23 family metallopeptidase [Paenibacillus caui]|uniref:M23 family metallopeptidase n=1 Tax=Paenibacillus caui TaxID=2873927 RepID=UPI001CA7D8C7|nr:M23 family metallopeptidase [Paenibacillus caui]
MKGLIENFRKRKSESSLWDYMKSSKIWISTGSLLLAGGVFLAGHQYVEANKVPYYRVYFNGEEIGAVKNKQQLNEAYKEKQEKLKQQYPEANIVLQTADVSTVQDKSYKAEVDSEATKARLAELIPYHAEGVAIKIDGEVVGVVKDEAEAEAVMAQVKSRYVQTSATGGQAMAKLKKLSARPASSAQAAASSTAPKVESVSIVEKVEQEAFSGEASQIDSAETVVKRILQNKEESVTYEVKSGDTISSIAKRMGVSQKAIFQMNPGLSELKLQIGTKLNIKRAEATLTVKTVEQAYEQVATEPGVIIRKNAKLAAGKTIVVSPGRSGNKVMNYRVVKENGQLVSREWIGQKVTQASSPKIVVKGTLKIVKKVSPSSKFAWPLSSPRLTSTFGIRWNRLHKGIDLVSSNHAIKAAADGTVTFAGTQTGYGKCIVIKHADGYETLYGHLSRISIREGEKVSRGEKIGVMGNTGHSLGTHLHFEIHRNGDLQNPLKYLK